MSAKEGNWPDDVFSKREQRELLWASIAALREHEAGLVVELPFAIVEVATVATAIGILLADMEDDHPLFDTLRALFMELQAEYFTNPDIAPDEEMNAITHALNERFGYDEWEDE